MANFEIAKPTKVPLNGFRCCAETTLFLPKPTIKSQKPTSLKDDNQLIDWPNYNKGLISKGFVTLWLDDDTLANWYFQGPCTPNGLFRVPSSGTGSKSGIMARFLTNTKVDSERINDYAEGFKSTITSSVADRPALSPFLLQWLAKIALLKPSYRH